jgi:hypothetical protein
MSDSEEEGLVQAIERNSMHTPTPTFPLSMPPLTMPAPHSPVNISAALRPEIHSGTGISAHPGGNAALMQGSNLHKRRRSSDSSIDFDGAPDSPASAMSSSSPAVNLALARVRAGSVDDSAGSAAGSNAGEHTCSSNIYRQQTAIANAVRECNLRLNAAHLINSFLWLCLHLPR